MEDDRIPVKYELVSLRKDMLSEEAKTTIRNAVKFKYDEHVSRLLAIPEKHLKKIVPNKGLPIIEILEGHNADISEEVRRYGEVLRTELVRVIDNLGLNELAKEDKDLILQVIDDFCVSDLYKKRFEIILSSVERKIKSYGIVFDIHNYRVDIPKSCVEVDSENSIRRIKAIIANELNCRVIRNETKTKSEGNIESQNIAAKKSKLTVFKKIWTDPVLSKIIATIILAIAGLCLTWFHNKPVTAEEKAAVISLVNDIKSNPLIITGYLLKHHSFIDETWRKEKESLNYFETVTINMTLFEFNEMFLESTEIYRLFRPRSGVMTGIIQDFGYYKAGDQDVGFIKMSSTKKTRNSVEERLKLSDVDIYSTGEYFISPLIMNHVNDVNLPKSIRDSLRSLNETSCFAATFNKRISLKNDFIVLHQLPYDARFDDLLKRPQMALFSDTKKSNLMSFLKASAEFTNSIGHWQLNNKVYLHAYEKAYDTSSVKRDERAVNP